MNLRDSTASWLEALLEIGLGMPKASKQSGASTSSELSSAKLSVTGGVYQLELAVEPGAPGLVALGGRGAAGGADKLVDENGHVTVRGARGRLTLSADVDWEIELSGGVARARANLDGARLRSIVISGGATGVDLALGTPVGTVPVRISGGVHDFSISRPSGVGLRLTVSGGASKLALDEFFFGAVGGTTRMESHEFRDARDRYELEVSGGASNFRITSR